jgi:MFS family permease
MVSNAGPSGTLNEEASSDTVLATDDDPVTPDVPPTSGHGISISRAMVISIALGVLVFLQAANVSLLTTTQGVIAGDLDAFESVSWFTSAYLVPISGLAPVYGKLSYIFPASYCLFGSSLVMAVGAAVTAYSPSLEVFLIGRVITGIGGAGVLTFAQVLIQLTGPKRKGLAQAILNTGYTIGVAAGAVIAGALEPHLGWRSLFWLQLPFAIAVALVLLLAVPSSITSHGMHQPLLDNMTMMEKVTRIDYIGAILLITSIVGFLYGLASHTFDTLSITLILTSLFILLPIFVYQEAYRHDDPIIPVHVLKSRGVFFCCIATLGYMMSRWSVLFYTPVYATALRNMPPAEAGSFLVPTNFGFAVGNLASGWVHIRRDGSFYASCLVIFTLFPISLALIAFLSTSTVSLYVYWFLLFLNGLFAGAGMNYSVAHIQHLVRPSDRIIAIALFNTFRGFAGTFGATVGGGIFTRALRAALDSHFEGLNPPRGLLRELMGSPRAVQKLSGRFRVAAMQGYTDALKALFLAGVGLALLTLVLQAFTGWKSPEQLEFSHDSGDETNVSVASSSDISARSSLFEYSRYNIVARWASGVKSRTQRRRKNKRGENERDPLLGSTTQ